MSSESLLELAEELDAEAFFSQSRKRSTKDGAFCALVLVLFAFRSFSNALLALANPLVDRKEDTAARSCGGTTALLLVGSACQRKSMSVKIVSKKLRRAINPETELIP